MAVDVAKIVNVEISAIVAQNIKMQTNYRSVANVPQIAHAINSVSAAIIASVVRENNMRGMLQKIKDVWDAVPAVLVALIARVVLTVGAASTPKARGVGAIRVNVIVTMDVRVVSIANAVPSLCHTVNADVMTGAFVDPIVNAKLDAAVVQSIKRKFVLNNHINTTKPSIKDVSVVHNADVDHNVDVVPSADVDK